MAITNEDIVALASAFHDASMVKKSTAAEMAEFFLYPELRIFVLHRRDPAQAREQFFLVRIRPATIVAAKDYLDCGWSDRSAAVWARILGNRSCGGGHDVAAELRAAPEAHR